MKLSELKSNPKNPRLIKDDKFLKLVKSIEEFPEMMEKRPMVCVTDVDGKLYPLGGNMRLKALQELKYKDIPDSWVILADEWTVEKRNEFVIKDNVGFGEWDFEQLAAEWNDEDLKGWGVDMPEIMDYSDKNKEIDTNLFDDEMIIKLKYTEEEYTIVREQLSKISSTPEMAVWKLLGNE